MRQDTDWYSVAIFLEDFAEFLASHDASMSVDDKGHVCLDITEVANHVRIGRRGCVLDDRTVSTLSEMYMRRQ